MVRRTELKYFTSKMTLAKQLHGFRIVGLTQSKKFSIGGILKFVLICLLVVIKGKLLMLFLTRELTALFYDW